jgi:hypothetical protein
MVNDRPEVIGNRPALGLGELGLELLDLGGG